MESFSGSVRRGPSSRQGNLSDFPARPMTLGEVTWNGGGNDTLSRTTPLQAQPPHVQRRTMHPDGRAVAADGGPAVDGRTRRFEDADLIMHGQEIRSDGVEVLGVEVVV